MFHNFLNMPQVYRGSEYYSSYKYTFWIYLSQNIRKFCFRKYKKVPFPEMKGFFRGFRFLQYKNSFLLRKYKKFFRGFRFMKYKKFSGGILKCSISRNIRSFFRTSASWNIRNFHYKGFPFPEFVLTWEQRGSISWNIRNIFRGGFCFIFSTLGWKVRLVALKCTTSRIYR